jgi:hypothetical protein
MLAQRSISPASPFRFHCQLPQAAWSERPKHLINHPFFGILVSGFAIFPLSWKKRRGISCA